MNTYAEKRRTAPQQRQTAPGQEQLQPKLDAMQDIDVHSGHSLQLEDSLKSRIEQHLGYDLSGVELRESQDAANIGAEAFAKGNVVHFAPGRFDQNSTQGQHLIAHELSHVVQQAKGGVHADVDGFNVNASSAFESAADHAGDSFISGGHSALSAPLASLPTMNADAAPIQGSFIDSIKNLFGKKKEMEISGPTNVNEFGYDQELTDEERSSMRGATTLDIANYKILKNLTSGYIEKHKLTDKDFHLLNMMIGGRAAQASKEGYDKASTIHAKKLAVRGNDLPYKNQLALQDKYAELNGSMERYRNLLMNTSEKSNKDIIRFRAIEIAKNGASDPKVRDLLEQTFANYSTDDGFTKDDIGSLALDHYILRSMASSIYKGPEIAKVGSIPSNLNKDIMLIANNKTDNLDSTGKELAQKTYLESGLSDLNTGAGTSLRATGAVANMNNIPKPKPAPAAPAKKWWQFWK